MAPEKMQSQGEALSDGELLAILIRVGVGRKVHWTCCQLPFGPTTRFTFLVEATIEELSRIKGIGLAKASQIKAAVELGDVFLWIEVRSDQ